jgi:murein L,D-transpeptidase YcbB/YkuD
LKETPGWDRDHIDEVIRSGERVDVKIMPQVPVYWVYVTAWATPEGVLQFRDDIYQRDGFGAPGGAAAPSQPVAQNARPASSRLAPMNDDEN